jgi:putative acetyltransferase
MRFKIRPETSADYEDIDRVLESAFSQKNEATLVRKLRETKDYLPELSLLALANKEPAGHILFYPLKNKGYMTLILAPWR